MNRIVPEFHPELAGVARPRPLRRPVCSITSCSLPHQILAHRLIGWYRSWITLGVFRCWKRCEPNNDHFSRRVDIDSLPVHASCGKAAVLVVKDPPHATITATFQCSVPRLCKGFLVATGPNVFHHLLREQTLPIYFSAIQHQQTDAPQVPKTGTETTAGKRSPFAVDGHVSILFRAHLTPDPLGQEACNILSLRPRNDPSQGIRIDGFVAESFAVETFLFDGLKILKIAVWTSVILWLWQWARST